MGLFDKKKNDISFPQKENNVKPVFPEPPQSLDDLDDLGSVKTSVEAPSMPEPPENNNVDSSMMEEEMESDIMGHDNITQHNEPSSLKSSIPSANPILYIKLSEYKEVVQATNNMRKDIEKAKNIIGDLRMIEKDEHSKLEKSEEIIKEVEDIISLFERVMVTPIE